MSGVSCHGVIYRGSMAGLQRIVVPGYPHHVTQRGVRSMAAFHSERDRREYIGVLGDAIERRFVSNPVWSLMANHVHFVAVPHQGTSLAKAFGSAQRFYTRLENLLVGVSRVGLLPIGRIRSAVAHNSIAQANFEIDRSHALREDPCNTRGKRAIPDPSWHKKCNYKKCRRSILSIERAIL